jgi:3-oxo-5-alpha-steroid 4-dehydrogenase 3
MPAGGLFELVSCPHYLAEIIIYLGLLIASEGQLMPLLMLVWVVSSLDAGRPWALRQFFQKLCRMLNDISSQPCIASMPH